MPRSARPVGVAAFLELAYTGNPALCGLVAAARPIPDEHPVMSTECRRVVLASPWRDLLPGVLLVTG
jgi:hypothetical protein